MGRALRQVVLLEGGPFHGESRRVHPTTNELVEVSDVGPAVLWPPPARQIVPASYRRVDDTVFRFCRTQSAVGDRDRDFPEEGEES